jgi:hypothetical protein
MKRHRKRQKKRHRKRHKNRLKRKRQMQGENEKLVGKIGHHLLLHVDFDEDRTCL